MKSLRRGSSTGRTWRATSPMRRQILRMTMMASGPWLWWRNRMMMSSSSSSSSSAALAFHLTPCTRKQQAQFQFPDCYVPPMRTDIPFVDASFVMSHDAATGYIQPVSPRGGSSSSSGSSSGTGSWSWWYSKNQVGSVHQQLQDGARALDLRPYLYRNGTVAFHHGIIRIPVRMDTAVNDIRQWCFEQPEELVLVLFSHFAYESNNDAAAADSYYYSDSDSSSSSSSSSMISAITHVLTELGVAYVDCSAVYGMTVGQVMDLASITTTTSSSSNNNNNNQNDSRQKGYLLAMDGHDTYGTSCAKENWVESQIVTCYPKQSPSCLTTSSHDLFDTRLRPYLLASANTPATDDTATLGPPLDLTRTPLNEIQALWQVTTSSALIGMEHGSSLLHDNVQSHINARVMSLIYHSNNDNDDDDDDDQVVFITTGSVVALDNVATNGNAVGSVLRTQCGQFNSTTVDTTTNNNIDDAVVATTPCGNQLPLPPLVYHRARWESIRDLILCGLVGSVYLTWLWYSVVYHQRPKLLYTAYARWLRMMIHQRQQQQQSGTDIDSAAPNKEGLLT